jgi:hypothetical protein
MEKSARKIIKILAISVILLPLLLKGNEIKESVSMASSVSHDVCELNLIYNKGSGYEYSLPRGILEGFLSGKAFDEALRLRADIHEIYQNILAKSPLKENLAVITAGAPGAGKTIKMVQVLSSQSAAGKEYAYICPDDVCLKQQTQTYQKDVQAGDGSKEARLAAYNKWRPGSNAANHLILANLIREKYAFYFGTTSTSPATGKFFDFLKKQGYQIRLIHLTAPDDVRWESIRERDKAFVQTTEQDVHEKGLLLPQRIMDTFLEFADEIEFYYRGAVKGDADLAATWVRNPKGASTLGTLKIVSYPKYEQIKAIHDQAVEVLKKPDLAWKETVEKHSKIISGS